MPIWIKYGNSLLLCNGFSFFEESNSGNWLRDDIPESKRRFDFSAYLADGSERNPYIAVKNLTESQAQDLMRDITRAVASGDRYFEIPERYMQNERT